jgi:hypothetical protein
VAPYVLTLDGRSARRDLIYRFEEDVFDPTDPGAQNLASMMAAQVALNYGLFADEIVFTGRFDGIDRKFIREMAENTAREIAVKKFLEPNPFLRGSAARLPAIRRQRYCRAILRFEHLPTDPVHPRTTCPWEPSPARHAILSSGGKESLLTFAAMQEIGCDVYPIFVNESGRHWFTALNAYRHLAGTHPGTRRVWTNCDRVFAWFLRHLPFIRQDFARVRSDDYPIRLWTVAVFVFGALPLMRRNGIGRLLIGDEFDTSRRCSLHGIPHYDGLFDQSRYFDTALTKYFAQKGWAVRQFSAVRCLSEFLVQQIMAERYPDLWRHQMSCHAGHLDNGYVRPCGRCEKCRRIVSMLVALGQDPTGCGYTHDQVDNCLRALANTEVHQEAAVAQHVAYLLTQKGIIRRSRVPGLRRPHARREITKLRFDPDKSPLADIPLDIRQGILRVFLDHAEGVLSRTGHRWQEVDALAEPALHVSHAGST